MTGRLAGKVAIVTGSNSGIGRSIALAYGREGAKVVCATRQAESKDPDEQDVTTNDAITKEGGEAVWMKLTFTDADNVNSLMQEVVKKYGRIDVLVNCAGSSGVFAPFWTLSDEDFDAVIDVNVKGTFKCMRAAAAVMVKQEPGSNGIRGRIINIGSVFGPRGVAMTLGYSASKCAVISMTKSAAADLSPHKVLVNTINPGTVETSKTKDIPEEFRKFLGQKALIGFGSPEDIAKPAVFFASDDSSWIQGTELFVDGGYVVT